MNPEEVLSLLEGIGAMLSPTAQKVWVIALRNIVVQGYITLAWAVVTFLGIVVCVGIGCRGLALERKFDPDAYRDSQARKAKDFAESLTIGGFITAALFLIAFIPLISVAISYLSVPEYYAIQKLMVMLRGTP